LKKIPDLLDALRAASVSGPDLAGTPGVCVCVCDIAGTPGVCVCVCDIAGTPGVCVFVCVCVCERVFVSVFVLRVCLGLTR